MLSTAARTAYDADLDLFRDQVRKFFDKELYPHLDRWEEDGIVDREFWKAYGAAGLLCPQVPAEYGGLGLDYRYNAVIGEELSYAGSSAGVTLQSDITVDYIINYGSEELKQRLLPGMVSGEIITAIDMTEPGTGSDLQGVKTTAIRDGNHYVLNGSKTYITNGQNADVVIVVAKTDPSLGSKGISLILVERGTPGFERGRNLDKVGLDAADTSELFFEDVRVPITNCLGEEGKGFIYLMSELPQERTGIAISAQTAAQRAFDMTVEFCRERKAFGKPILDFQNTRFVLADLKAKLQVGWAHLDWVIARHLKHELTPVEASAAKLWHTELQGEVVDKCLQLHGGAGFMNEYAIAKQWRGARVTRIFGGTSEIMKELIGRKL